MDSDTGRRGIEKLLMDGDSGGYSEMVSTEPSQWENPRPVLSLDKFGWSLVCRSAGEREDEESWQDLFLVHFIARYRAPVAL